MTGTEPICTRCRHFHWQDGPGLTCDAFPKGIPDDILDGEVSHEQAVSGDSGIVFDPLTVPEWAEHRISAEGDRLEAEHPDHFRLIFVSGQNKLRYPARYHMLSRRIYVYAPDSPQVAKSFDMDRPMSVQSYPASQETYEELTYLLNLESDFILKAAGHPPASSEVSALLSGFEPGHHFTAEELRELNLRWITAHPPNSEATIHLLVHDDGKYYTVVGGAGGKLNQMVLSKTPSDASQHKQWEKERKLRRKQKLQAMREDSPQEVQRMEEADRMFREKSKSALSAYREKAMQVLGVKLDEIREEAGRQAEGTARTEMPHGTPEQIEEFVAHAQRKAVSEVNKEIDKGLQRALDRAARARILNQVPDQSVEIEAVVNGEKIVRELDPKQLDALIQDAATIDKYRHASRVIRKALASGNVSVVRGVQDIVAQEATPDEANAWLQQGQHNRASVLMNTALVNEMQKASPDAQRRHNNVGACDALNAYVHAKTGMTMFSPEQIEAIGGIENACRIVVSALSERGMDGQHAVQELTKHVISHGDAVVAASLVRAQELDAISQSAMEAAKAEWDEREKRAEDEKPMAGAVTWSQALITRQTMEAWKFSILGMAQGSLRAASTLLHFVEEPRSGSLVMNGGDTQVAAKSKATALGLDDGDFQIVQRAGGYNLEVDEGALKKLASFVPTPLADEADRMRNVEQRVNDELLANPQFLYTGDAYGMNDKIVNADTGEERPIFLQNHQVLAVEAILSMRRILGNYGPGSGKTAIMYGAAARLLRPDPDGLRTIAPSDEGKPRCSKGIIVIPAKPRAQQEDPKQKPGADPLAPLAQIGEKRKFLSGEMVDHFEVVSSTKDLQDKIRRVNDADDSLQVLIMSPAMLRDNVQALVDAGFGADDSFVFLDEAHEFTIGTQDKEGSGKAQRARELAEGAGYLFAGSGTFLEQDASEVLSAAQMARPDLFPKEGSEELQKMKARLSREWTHAAQQMDTGVFSGSQIGILQHILRGIMLNYSEPPTRNKKEIDQNTGQERVVEENVGMIEQPMYVPLGEDQKDTIRRLNADLQASMESSDLGERNGAIIKWQGRVAQSLIGENMYAAVDKILSDHPDSKAVVWCMTLDPIHALEERLGTGNCVTITGENGDKETQAALTKFKEDPNARVAIISNAGNYGLNLQDADIIIGMGVPFNYSTWRQIIGRALRTGQQKDVTVIPLIADFPLAIRRFLHTIERKGRDTRLLEAMGGQVDDTLVGPVLGMNLNKIMEVVGEQEEKLAAKRQTERSDS